MTIICRTLKQYMKEFSKLASNEKYQVVIVIVKMIIKSFIS